MAKVHKDFKLSTSIMKKLPSDERKTAEKALLAKAAGKCAICNRPLGKNYDLIAADHRVPESKGGKTSISNLYLAHKSCNASRGDVDFDLIRPLIEFKVFSEGKSSNVRFNEVIDRYVENGNQQVMYSLKGDLIQLQLGSDTANVPVYADPATGTKFFFCELPVKYIQHDEDIQPRLIMHDHVRRLALDFNKRPVHEPSNCRLVDVEGRTADLKQFDGQHKTTAQILLGREAIPIKVYINPAIPMLQELVVKIQQEIKKVPLTRSDTLAKLGDVVGGLLESYNPGDKVVRTEEGFIKAQPRDRRAETKRMFLNDLARIIYFDQSNELREWVRPGSTYAPTTDKVVIDKMIKPLIFQGLLDIDMDAAGGRDNEKKYILLILNTITRKMLPKDWYTDRNKLQRKRTENFFYQGSIGWWMGEILLPALRYLLIKLNLKKPLLIDQIDSEQESKVIEAVEALCDWEIWSTGKQEHLKAMRSNTVANMIDVFPELTSQRLIKEVQS